MQSHRTASVRVPLHSMRAVPPNSVHPLDRAARRAWLERHHGRAEGGWLVAYEKAAGKPRVEYEEAVEEALCFGWIDSKRTKLDAVKAREASWPSPFEREIKAVRCSEPPAVASCLARAT